MKLNWTGRSRTWRSLFVLAILALIIGLVEFTWMGIKHIKNKF